MLVNPFSIQGKYILQRLYFMATTVSSLLLILFIYTSCQKAEQLNGSAIASLFPNASAGQDQVVTIPLNQTISLDGSASRGGTSDPIREYRWKIIAPRAYDSIEFNTARISFFIPTSGTYIFELTVVSSKGLTDQDTVNISAILDTICNVVRTTLPMTLKELAIMPQADYDPQIFSIANKLIFTGTTGTSASMSAKVFMYDMDLDNLSYSYSAKWQAGYGGYNLK